MRAPGRQKKIKEPTTQATNAWSSRTNEYWSSVGHRLWLCLVDVGERAFVSLPVLSSQWLLRPPQCSLLSRPVRASQLTSLSTSIPVPRLSMAPRSWSGRTTRLSVPLRHFPPCLSTSYHADWFKRAAVANVDSINADNVPRVSNDESFAEIFRDSLQARPALAQDWAGALAAVAVGAAATAPGAAAPAAAAPPARPPRAAPPPAAPATHPAPLTPANAVGRRVLVPAQLYPQYRCDEQGGRGWEALVVRATATTAVVHYVSARTADGRPYADDRLPLSRLKPI